MMPTCREKEMDMKTKSPMDELEVKATEALRSLLGQVSVIKLKSIQREAKGTMLAQIDVLGHSHTLACEVTSAVKPEGLRSALRDIQNCAAGSDCVPTPVVIAPYLSPEAQQFCKENQAGYLDLEGNARLALGEFFIGKRAHSHRIPATSMQPETHAARASRVRIHPTAA
jgi:hypothetical protein